jgi:hypothetical protein
LVGRRSGLVGGFGGEGLFDLLDGFSGGRADVFVGVFLSKSSEARKNTLGSRGDLPQGPGSPAADVRASVAEARDEGLDGAGVPDRAQGEARSLSE